MITRTYAEAIEVLRRQGWRSPQAAGTIVVPADIRRRYDWVPPAHWSFTESVTDSCAPDDKSWVVTAADFVGNPNNAFLWNEWELQSLDAAASDLAWRGTIVKFWDAHVPIAMSVRSGYAYLAMNASLGVVYGREPEYEDVTVIAKSCPEALFLLAENAPSIVGLGF